MAIKKTLGGDRLGSGKKMKVELHGYERSNHDLSYIWRSTMSAGTLVPFMAEVALPGDTFDIDLDADGMTHPTVGPLFGSFKLQLDVFQVPIRLYNAKLHNNALGIGMNMQSVKLPQIRIKATNPIHGNVTGSGAGGTEPPYTVNNPNIDWDNTQINPSSILSHLNIRGIQIDPDLNVETTQGDFNAVPFLAYWDIFKNYYANKQEDNAYVIHAKPKPIVKTITGVQILVEGAQYALPELTQIAGNAMVIRIDVRLTNQSIISWSGDKPNMEDVLLLTDRGNFPFADLFEETSEQLGEYATYIYKGNMQGLGIWGWMYDNSTTVKEAEPNLQYFPLTNIDDMRNAILADINNPNAFIIDETTQLPYSGVLKDIQEDEEGEPVWSKLYSQEGLAVKTYQSDLFNNWLQTDWIDGDNGINAITAIDTSSGEFNIDTFNLAKKVYDMLNRIAVSGGSYHDWLEAVYTHEGIRLAESPIYCGGLIKELVFQEVVSNAQTPEQPLATLAGKGRLSDKHKGGKVVVRVDEPSYIMGIVSLTPRVDYSQGNKWDTELKTMDDFHKPALDQIGFQDLMTKNMAWWSTGAAGKQPAWINYMTNVNVARGNFAIKDNQMFMTLNRQYNLGETPVGWGIDDLTTYIDPAKYNYIFAETTLSAQNFWMQIKADITARRKMSAKIMPNL